MLKHHQSEKKPEEIFFFRIHLELKSKDHNVLKKQYSFGNWMQQQKKMVTGMMMTMMMMTMMMMMMIKKMKNLMVYLG